MRAQPDAPWATWLDACGRPPGRAEAPVVLAPMQGVTDPPMRSLLAEVGGYAWAVSEFIRVTEQVPPDAVILKLVPELRHGQLAGGRLPVQPQILGGVPTRVAATAARCVALGAGAIDLNFGCPAPTVNRHDGGASILKEPSRLTEIIGACVSQVPAHIAVSAKLRLGWCEEDEIFETALAAYRGGAQWLTIHARTRAQNYAPPAHFENFAQVQKEIGCPIIANGDLFSLDAWIRCQEETGLGACMLGRGAVADPYLGHRLAQAQSAVVQATATLPAPYHISADMCRRLLELSDSGGSSRHRAGRLKQWIRMRHAVRPCPLYQAIKQLVCPAAIINEIMLSAARDNPSTRCA